MSGLCEAEIIMTRYFLRSYLIVLVQGEAFLSRDLIGVFIFDESCPNTLISNYKFKSDLDLKASV